VHKQSWCDACVRLAEARQDFCPTVEAVGVRNAQVDAKLGVLRGDGRPITLPGEDISASHKPFQI
jgi:hypothetical protein